MKTIKKLEKEIEERLELLGKQHTISCKLKFAEQVKPNKGWLKEMIKEEKDYALIEAKDDFVYCELKAILTEKNDIIKLIEEEIIQLKIKKKGMGRGTLLKYNKSKISILEEILKKIKGDEE